VDTKEFKVTKLPLATVHLVKDGKPLEISNGIDKNIENISIQIIPPTETQEESQYKANISITIKRDGKVIFIKDNVSLGSSLDDIFQKTQENDLIVIKTVDIKRKNAKSEYILTKTANPIMVIPVN
jgi:hypothetical protein